MTNKLAKRYLSFGSLSEQSRKILQTQVLDPLKRWAAISSDIFRPDRSRMTHFSRNKKKLLASGGDSSLEQPVAGYGHGGPQAVNNKKPQLYRTVVPGTN